jgi:hypothetical protein
MHEGNIMSACIWHDNSVPLATHAVRTRRRSTDDAHHVFRSCSRRCNRAPRQSTRAARAPPPCIVPPDAPIDVNPYLREVTLPSGTRRRTTTRRSWSWSNPQLGVKLDRGGARDRPWMIHDATGGTHNARMVYLLILLRTTLPLIASAFPRQIFARESNGLHDDNIQQAIMLLTLGRGAFPSASNPTTIALITRICKHGDP